MVPILGHLSLTGLFILTSAAKIKRFESTLTKENVLFPGYDGRIAPWMAAPTHPPDLQFAAIAVKRDVATCGFWIGSTERPLYCEPGQSCVTSGRFFDCGYKDSRLSSTCYPASHSVCTGSQEPGRGTVCCTYSSRDSYCVTALKTVTSDFVETLTAFYCGNSAWSGAWSIGDTSATTTSRVPSTSESLSTTTPITTTTTVQTPTATVEPPPPINNAPPVGAIVGGVLGGLVVIGVSIFAIVWMHGRNKRNNDKPDNIGTPGQNLPYTPEVIKTPGSSADSSQFVYKPASNGYKGNHSSTNSMDVTPPYNAHSQHPRGYEHQPGDLSPISSHVPAYRTASQDLSMQGVFEVPCTNAAGTGNNATELPSEHHRPV